MHAAPRPRRLGRLARVVLSGSIAVAASSAVALAATAPADAAVTTSPYALTAAGFGTQVYASQVSLRSAATAHSIIGCTKKAGLYAYNSQAATNLNSAIKIGALSTAQRTYRTGAGDTVVSSTTAIASVQIGTSTLGLRISGLRGATQAWGTKAGKLHASSTFTFSDISPLGTTSLPYPLNMPADAILKQLTSNGPVTVPGLGVIKLGAVSRGATTTYAGGTSVGLQVHLFGADGLNKTADDSDLTIAQTYARLTKGAPYGVFGGGAWGLDATALGGIASVGKTPSTMMPCSGTGGVVRSSGLAGLNLASQNQLQVNGLHTRIYGRQGLPRGGQTAWTESTVAGVDLGNGALHISGIVARARIVRTAKNRYSTTYVQDVGSITAGGQAQRIPTPGAPLEIPGVARIEVPAPTRLGAYSLKVTGLRITLLGGSAAQTVVNLATAQTIVKSR